MRAAGTSGNPLRQAQARVSASDAALSVPTRLVKLFAAAGVLSADEMASLEAAADLPGAMALQAGRLADMNAIAEGITGYAPS